MKLFCSKGSKGFEFARGMSDKARGEYRGRYLWSKKKRQNLLRNLHRRKKIFFLFMLWLWRIFFINAPLITTRACYFCARRLAWGSQIEAEKRCPRWKWWRAWDDLFSHLFIDDDEELIGSWWWACAAWVRVGEGEVLEHRACVTIDRRSADVNLCSLVHTQDCFERLLVTGTGAAALERKDPFSGETPLIAQVQLGERENAERLLQAGADANAAAAGTPPPLSCQAVVRARTCWRSGAALCRRGAGAAGRGQGGARGPGETAFGLQGRGRRTLCRMLFLKKKAVCFFSLSLSLFGKSKI